MSHVLQKLRDAARVRWETSSAIAEQKEIDTPVKLVPIASGKGGVGKTNIAVGIGVSAGLRFSKTDKRVLLIDGDLGMPNTDLVLGVRPQHNIAEVIDKAVDDISELVSQTRYPSLDFIAGAEEATLLLSNLYYQQRRSLMGKITRLKASLIIFDLGASASKEILDFFSMSSTGIVVLNPEPSSIRDGYVFIKNALIRRVRQQLEFDGETRKEFDIAVEATRGNWTELHRSIAASGSSALRSIHQETLETFRPMIIVNRVDSLHEGLETARGFIRTAETHLGIRVRYLGPVQKDDAVTRSVKARCPFRIAEPESPASRCIDEITSRLLNDNDIDLDKNFAAFGKMITSRILGREV